MRSHLLDRSKFRKLLRVGGLPAKLIKARNRRGLSLYRAAQTMGISAGTLHALEGSNPNRPPALGAMQIKTAVAITELYWPEIELSDLMGSDSLVTFRPRNGACGRTLNDEALAS